MSEPLKHIARAEPPWRTVEHTECGRDLSDTGAVVSREQAVADWKEFGQQRAAFIYCMTCAQTANRNSTWESNPLDVMSRYASRYRKDRDAVNHELRVIASLIEAHRDEFDEAIAGFGQMTDLGSVRALKRKAAR